DCEQSYTPVRWLPETARPATYAMQARTFVFMIVPSRIIIALGFRTKSVDRPAWRRLRHHRLCAWPKADRGDHPRGQNLDFDGGDSGPMTIQWSLLRADFNPEAHNSSNKSARMNV